MPKNENNKEAARSDFKVRAIRRGLEVLQAVNRLGSGRLIDISEATQIPYPTVCRIVDTLLDLNMIEREEGRRHYRPAPLVQSLSLGFQEDDLLVRTAQSILSGLCDEVGWPVTIGTRVGNAMMVRASTHRQTTLTYNNYFPGYTLPLLDCSIGKATLAFCNDQERKNIRQSLTKSDIDDPQTTLYLRDEDAFVRPFQAAGYAFHTYTEHTKNPRKTSSLSVPVFVNGEMQAAMGLIYFSSAMSTKDAAAKYIDAMKKAAHTIESKL